MLHLAVIMDGNRRWARSRNLPLVQGHRAGAERAQDLIANICAFHPEVTCLSLFALSVDNMNRLPSEVRSLLALLARVFSRLQEVQPPWWDQVAFQFYGQLEQLPSWVQRQTMQIQSRHIVSPRLRVNVFLNYGGREALLAAFKTLIAQGVTEPTAADVLQALYPSRTRSDVVPSAPDLLIRTSGEQRLSNFCLWDLAYTELHFCQCLWPDFDSQALAVALGDFASRTRRFGTDAQRTVSGRTA